MNEKTQPPTPRRLREASQRGEIARSRTLTAAGTLLLASLLLVLLAPAGLAIQLRLLDRVFATGTRGWDVLATAVAPAGIAACLAVATACLPCGLVVELAQTRLAFASKALRPRFDRLDPAGNLRQHFSLDTLADLASTLVQVGACIGVLLYFLVQALDEVRATMPLEDPAAQLVLASRRHLHQLAGSAALLLPLGIADLWLKRRLQSRRLRMSQQEVRRERREDEGSPEIRQRAREAHQHATQHDDAPGTPAPRP